MRRRRNVYDKFPTTWNANIRWNELEQTTTATTIGVRHAVNRKWTSEWRRPSGRSAWRRGKCGSRNFWHSLPIHNNDGKRSGTRESHSRQSWLRDRKSARFAKASSASSASGTYMSALTRRRRRWSRESYCCWLNQVSYRWLFVFQGSAESEVGWLVGWLDIN